MLTWQQDYHANFISLTRNKATADALINRSPITYRLRTSNSNSNQLSKPIKKSALSTGDQDSSEEVSTAIEASADPSQGERTEFTLNIWPAEDYEHLQGATGSALHDGWSTTYLTDRSFAVEALKQALPNTIAAEGLAYWPQDMPKMQKDRKKERLEMKQWLPFGMASPGKKRNAGSNRTQRDPDLGPD